MSSTVSVRPRWLWIAILVAWSLAFPGHAQPTEPVFLGVALDAVSAESNFDGSFAVTYAILVANLGNTELTSIGLQNDLLAAFPQPAEFEVLEVSSETAGVMDSFDGLDQQAMLAGTDALGPGDTFAVTLVIQVTPNVGEGTYRNTVLATATSVSGETVSDASQDGTEPDPDGDSDATNNNEPTAIALSTAPVIGVAKELVSISDSSEGIRTVEFVVHVGNYGNVPLLDVQIREDLIAAFPNPVTTEVDRVRSTDFVLNPDFNGTTDQDLLAGVDRLNPGERGSLSLTLLVTPNGGGSWFRNRCFASAHGLGDDVAFDLSEDGDDPDPDGDGDPTNNNLFTELFFAEMTAGGYMETTTVFSPDPFSIEIESIVLNAFLEINGFKSQLDARLTQTTFDVLTIGNSLTLGEIPLTSTLVLNPSLVEFVSWQAGASLEWGGVGFSEILFLTTPPESSYNQVSVRGNPGDFNLEATVKLGVCPLEFWESSICGDWVWPSCDVPLSACLTFTDAVGFDALTVSAAGIPVFTDIVSFDSTLDASLEYSTEEKILSPNLKVTADWGICPEITLLGEIVLTSGTLGIDGFSIYGIEAEVPVGPVTFFVGDSLVDAKNSAITGKADYFEVIGIESPLASCCGTPGQFTLATYFERPPAPSGGLLGIGLIEGLFESQFSDHFAVSVVAQYRPVAPAWWFSVSMRVLW